MSKNRTRNRFVIVCLLTLFVFYNLNIYWGKSHSTSRELTSVALSGEDLWQKNNCVSCHQLYGLGGYLGPDLTNISSNPMKNEAYILSFLDGGVGTMPEFHFTQEEKMQILAFLKYVDSTGYYPVRNASFEKNGWVSIPYKK